MARCNLPKMCVGHASFYVIPTQFTTRAALRISGSPHILNQTNNLFCAYTRRQSHLNRSEQEMHVHCKAASNDFQDVIDVEGTKIDDRIPVTVSIFVRYVPSCVLPPVPMLARSPLLTFWKLNIKIQAWFRSSLDSLVVAKRLY